MKLLSVILSLAISFCSPKSKKENTSPEHPQTGLQGKKYIGPPTKEISQPGCEGCGERGYVHFNADYKYAMVFPGDDIIETGNYRVEGNRIYLELYDVKNFVFILSNDQKKITSEDNTIIMNLEN
jgi:hypothetical protein